MGTANCIGVLASQSYFILQAFAHNNISSRGTLITNIRHDVDAMNLVVKPQRNERELIRTVHEAKRLAGLRRKKV